jgi:putative ABC transport system ATP-binding protein
MFELSDVQKTYERRGQRIAALESANLRIDAGQYVALVGPSGSGKTTLLSILGGMLAPTAGQMLLDGRALYQLSVAERARLRRELIGFVFQTFNLIPYLTALENVQTPMLLAGVDFSAQRMRGMDLLERVGLADRMHHKPAELSTGQQQRVALARTLANDPRVILADEPTGNLDPAMREEVLGIFDSFHSEGKTIVVVTHDPSVACRAERTLRIEQGLLREEPAAARRCA